MEPETFTAMGEMGNTIQSLLNSFTDMAIMTKQRLMDNGWTDEGAEEFVMLTVTPQAAVFMETIMSRTFDKDE